MNSVAEYGKNTSLLKTKTTASKKLLLYLLGTGRKLLKQPFRWIAIKYICFVCIIFLPRQIWFAGQKSHRNRDVEMAVDGK